MVGGGDPPPGGVGAQVHVRHKKKTSGAKVNRHRSKVHRHNARAFAFSGGTTKAQRATQRMFDIQTKREAGRVTADKTPLVAAPPYVVVVQGAAGSGKTTLIRSLVKHYTRHTVTVVRGPVTLVSGKARRLTFVECPSGDVGAMVDLAKVADLVLLMIDGSFGFEMETFEFLNVLQVHGFPRVMGVLTHLDKFQDNSTLRKTKKKFKNRFWAEIYDGAKLFYLSGLQYGRYNTTEITNLARFISVQKFLPLSFRSARPYVLALRCEADDGDAGAGGCAAGAAGAADGGENGTAAFGTAASGPDTASGPVTLKLYGYVKGSMLHLGQPVHVPGIGDFSVSELKKLEDPCAAPQAGPEKKGDSNRHLRTLKVDQRRFYAPDSDLGAIQYDDDVMHITLPQRQGVTFTPKEQLIPQTAADFAAASAPEAAPPEAVQMVRALQNARGEMFNRLAEGREMAVFAPCRRREEAASGTSTAASSDEARRRGSGESGESGEESDGGSDGRGSGESESESDDGESSESGSESDVGERGNHSSKETTATAAVRGSGRAGDDGSASFGSHRSRQPARSESGEEWGERRAFSDSSGAESAGSEADSDGGAGSGRRGRRRSLGVEGPVFTAGAAGGGGGDASGAESGGEGPLLAAAAGGGGDASGLSHLKLATDAELRQRFRRAATIAQVVYDAVPADAELPAEFFEDCGGAVRPPGAEEAEGAVRQLFEEEEEDGGGSAAGGAGGARSAASSRALPPLPVPENCMRAYSTVSVGAAGWGAAERAAAKRRFFITGGWDGEEPAEEGEDGGGGESDASRAARVRPWDRGSDAESEEGSDAGSEGGGVSGGIGKGRRGAGKKGGKNEFSPVSNEIRQLWEKQLEQRRAQQLELDEEKKQVELLAGELADAGAVAPIGAYVRVTLRNVSAAWYARVKAEHRPVILGGLLPGETELGLVQARVKRHRWAPKILKSNDPLFLSIGWRRFQTLPLYSLDDRNDVRVKMLKYTPEHMHCLMTFFGPATAASTGVIAIQNWKDKLKAFRISATGVVMEAAPDFRVMKKLKLVGTPQKIMKKTAFIQNMFSSDLEVAKCIHARVQTVSGIRGEIKKAVGTEGVFRATFEDRIVVSDIVICKAWVRVPLKEYYNPVVDLPGWEHVRTVAQLRRALQLAPADARHSEYGPQILREQAPAVTLRIPASLEKSLPFDVRPKSQRHVARAAKLTPLQELTARLSRPLPKPKAERRAEGLLAALGDAGRMREHERQVRAAERARKSAVAEKKVEAKRRERDLEQRKRKFAREGLQQKKDRKRMRIED